MSSLLTQLQSMESKSSISKISSPAKLTKMSKSMILCQTIQYVTMTNLHLLSPTRLLNKHHYHQLILHVTTHLSIREVYHQKDLLT